MKEFLDKEMEVSEEAKAKIIAVIRKKDRAIQGINEEQEKQAEDAVKNVEISDNLSIVHLPHSKCATVTDRLFGQYSNLLILSGDGEANFYGDGKLCADLKEKFEGWN